MAPRHKDGMKSPQGTFMPKVKMVMTSLRIRARMRSQMAWSTPGPAAAMPMGELTSVKLRL